MIPLIIPIKKHKQNKKMLLDLIEKSETSSITENDDKISRTDFHLSDEIERTYFSLFFDTVKDELFTAMKYLQYEGTLLKFWFQQYKKSDIHEWHFHPQTAYNVIYYIEVPNNMGTQVQIPPTGCKFQAMVDEGDMLIIPSTWKHRSPKNTTKKRKTVIAANIG